VAKPNASRQVLLATVGFVLVGLLWEGAVLLLRPPLFILPSPTEVARRATDYGGQWAPHFLATSLESVGGFLLAVALGIVLAVLLALVRPLDHLLSPVVTAFQIAPKVALAPLFIVWFGIGFAPKMLIAFLLAFFPVLVGARTGFAATAAEYLDLARVLGMGKLKTLWLIQLPASIPHIFAGAKVASTLAVIGAVVGEFVSSEEGLGYLVIIANNQLDTPLALASVILLTAFGLLLYSLVVLAEYLFTPWRRGREEVEVKGLW
jgi:NitT/TauT family transport system permease protein